MIICDFCQEFQDYSDKINDNDFISNKNRIIYTNNTWNLIPTIGCFVEGYSLVVNSKHRTSLYHCKREEQVSFKCFFNMIHNIYIHTYHTDVLLFEHGTVDENIISPASIDHVHLHILPFADEYTKITMIIKERGYQEYTLFDILDLNRIIDLHNIKTYLLYYFDNTFHLVNITGKNLPSQFLRKVTYELFYKRTDDGWNWKRYPFSNNMKKTYIKLKLNTNLLISHHFFNKSI